MSLPVGLLAIGVGLWVLSVAARQLEHEQTEHVYAHPLDYGTAKVTQVGNLYSHWILPDATPWCETYVKYTIKRWDSRGWNSLTMLSDWGWPPYRKNFPYDHQIQGV